MQVRLILIRSVEYHLQQILMRKLRHTRPFRHVFWEVKYSVTIMMLRDLHEVLRSSVREQIHPLEAMSKRVSSRRS
jgi:hypothetical protein